MESKHYPKLPRAAELPNELWIEIFENVDTSSLLRSSRVCKLWNQLIFQYMAHRFQLNLNPGQRMFPQNGIGMVSERKYKHLHLKSPTLDGAVMKIIEQLAPNLESLKLSLESLDYSTLMQILNLCTRLNDLSIKGYHYKYSHDTEELLHFLKKTKPAVSSLDLLHNKLAVFGRELRPCTLSGVRTITKMFPAIRSLGLDIANLDIFEKAFYPCIPNVAKLDIVVGEPEPSMIKWIAPRLKVLKVEVHKAASDSFFNLRLPSLEVLSLKLHTSLKSRVLIDFLLGCEMLKTALLSFAINDYDDLFPAVAIGLPLVEKLQVYSETITTLEGLEKMKHLKELSMKGGAIIAKSYYPVGPAPSVEKFEFHDVRHSDRVGNVLSRFENLRQVLMTVHELDYETINFDSSVLRITEFVITVDRANRDLIDLVQQMTRLEKLVVNADVFSKTNFNFLRRVIVLPFLKILVVNTNSELPVDVISKVVATNQACSLLLNGKRVEPAAVSVRLSAGVKCMALEGV